MDRVTMYITDKKWERIEKHKDISIDEAISKLKEYKITRGGSR